jgi:hypothetical protein
VRPARLNLVIVGYLSSEIKEKHIVEPEGKRPLEEMEIKVDEEAEEVVQVRSRFKRICVFCGSSHGKKKSYQDAAIELGKELVGFVSFLPRF